MCLEKVIQCKANLVDLLDDVDARPDEIVQELEKLDCLNITYKILKQAEIRKTVSKIHTAARSNTKVSQLSKWLLTKWDNIKRSEKEWSDQEGSWLKQNYNQNELHDFGITSYKPRKRKDRDDDDINGLTLSSPERPSESVWKSVGNGGTFSPEAYKGNRTYCNGGGGWNQPMRTSQELQDLMGEEITTRHGAVKAIWQYIKKNDLYDPYNRQYCVPDKLMARVFGKEPFRAFGMAKYLKDHLSKADGSLRDYKLGREKRIMKMAKKITGDQKENEYGFNENEFEQNAYRAYREREKRRKLAGKVPSKEDIQRTHRQIATFRRRYERETESETDENEDVRYNDPNLVVWSQRTRAEAENDHDEYNDRHIFQGESRRPQTALRKKFLKQQSSSDDDIKKVPEKIVKRRRTPRGNVQYLIKWKGCNEKENTWETGDDLDLTRLIRDYEARKKYKGEIENTQHWHWNDPSAQMSSGSDERSRSSPRRVEKILKKAMDANGNLEYLVLWSGTNRQTWEPLGNLMRYKSLIRKFEQRAEMKEGDYENNNSRNQPKVERILKKSVDQNGHVEYLVKWKYLKGEDTSEFIKAKSTTWEYKRRLEEKYNCKEIIEAFESKNKLYQRKPRQKIEVMVIDGTPNKGEISGSLCTTCHKFIDRKSSESFFNCRRCSRGYHLKCYIPSLTEEQASNCVCLLCTKKEKIIQLTNQADENEGSMGKRDLQICRRLVLEMHEIWPESKTFKSVKTLDFKLYRQNISTPMALDIISRRLNIGNGYQYETISSFIKDVRLMFSNCRTFWAEDEGGAHYITDANKMEIIFDKNLKEFKDLIKQNRANETKKENNQRSNGGSDTVKEENESNLDDSDEDNKENVFIEEDNKQHHKDKIQRKVKAGPASRKCRNDESSESSNEQDERNENSKGVDSSGKDTDVSNDNDDEEPRRNKLKVEINKREPTSASKVMKKEAKLEAHKVENEWTDEERTPKRKPGPVSVQMKNEWTDDDERTPKRKPGPASFQAENEWTDDDERTPKRKPGPSFLQPENETADDAGDDHDDDITPKRRPGPASLQYKNASASDDDEITPKRKPGPASLQHKSDSGDDDDDERTPKRRPGPVSFQQKNETQKMENYLYMRNFSPKSYKEKKKVSSPICEALKKIREPLPKELEEYSILQEAERMLMEAEELREKMNITDGTMTYDSERRRERKREKEKQQKRPRLFNENGMIDIDEFARREVAEFFGTEEEPRNLSDESSPDRDRVFSKAERARNRRKREERKWRQEAKYGKESEESVSDGVGSDNSIKEFVVSSPVKSTDEGSSDSESNDDQRNKSSIRNWPSTKSDSDANYRISD